LSRISTRPRRRSCAPWTGVVKKSVAAFLLDGLVRLSVDKGRQLAQLPAILSNHVSHIQRCRREHAQANTLRVKQFQRFQCAGGVAAARIQTTAAWSAESRALDVLAHVQEAVANAATQVERTNVPKHHAIAPALGDALDARGSWDFLDV